MADSDASKEDKQLPASERRLQQAAQEGNVARSRDAAHVLVLGVGVGSLAMAAAGIVPPEAAQAITAAIERAGEAVVLPAVRAALEPWVGDDGAVRSRGAAWLVTATA